MESARRSRSSGSGVSRSTRTSNGPFFAGPACSRSTTSPPSRIRKKPSFFSSAGPLPAGQAKVMESFVPAGRARRPSTTPSTVSLRTGRPHCSAVDGPDPGVEDAEEIVDLGDGRHGGPGVLARGLLLDGDGRRDALDEVGVRLVHPLQELAGVGGQGFDVAALALGVQGIEGQGGLPRAADAGHDDELVQRDVHVHVLQVVDPDSAELDDMCIAHRSRGSCRTYIIA